MRFLSLHMMNFKPYCDIPNGQHDVVLFDKGRRDRNICVNVGQTGSGKTSLSEAILWCLFGETYKPNWSKWVNLTAIAVARQKRKSTVDMQVSIDVDVDGEKYEITRIGTYVLDDQSFESKITVTSKGVVSKHPEKFISDHFPSATLMEYFVFDVDDFLKKFDDGIQKRIRAHIEKFAEIEKLDVLVKSLEGALTIIHDETKEKSARISEDKGLADEIEDLEKQKRVKNEAIESLKKRNEELTRDMNDLFKGALNEEEKKFFKYAEMKEELIEKIRDLNDEFLENHDLVRDMDLVLLGTVLNNAIDTARKKGTTRAEFETSSDIIRSALGKRYNGIVFDSEEGVLLVKDSAKIPSSMLVEGSEIAFASEEGGKAEALNAFNKYLSRSQSSASAFGDFRGRFNQLEASLVDISSKLDIMGGKAKDKNSLAKFKQYENHECERKENDGTVREIKEEIAKIDKKLNEKYRAQELSEMQRKEIAVLVRQEKFTGCLIQLAKETREEFLKRLLESVNEKASAMLRSIARESDRWHSIEVYSDFRFEIKDSKGNVIDTVDQVNRGNLQLSLMCFVFGLADYLGKDIPYVLDDPFIRLDPGHNRRLIEQLSRVHEQLILHLIPGMEYTPESYKWLSRNVNCQNWIYREKLMGEVVSRIIEKDAESMIEYDIGEL